MHSLLNQALELEGFQSVGPSIYVVKSAVLASIAPWSDFSILQVRVQDLTANHVLHHLMHM
eukprot:498529-Pelagomonas_calceolata.AAC.1